MGYDDLKNKKTVLSSTDHEIEVSVGEEQSVKVGYTVTVTEEVNLVGDYNEVLAYAAFFGRFPVAKSPYKMNDIDYPHFMFFHSGVTKPNELHRELFEKGYYQQATAEEMLTIFKVGELKEIASKLGVEIKGKKEDLISQLSQKADYEQIKNVLGYDIYSMNDKARKYLEDHQLEIEYYRLDDDSMTLEQYKKTREVVSKNDFRLNKLIKRAQSDKEQFGRNEYLSIGGIYESESKQKEALVSYIRALYIDLSGVSAYKIWMQFPNEKEFKSKNYSGISFAPGLIKYITDLKEYYTDDVIELACNPQLPIEACSKNMLKDILQLAFSGKLMESKEIRDKIEDALNSNFLKIGKSWTPKRTNTTHYKQRPTPSMIDDAGKQRNIPTDYEQLTERVSRYRKEEKIKEKTRCGWELLKEFAYKDGDTRVTYRRNKLDSSYSVWVSNDKTLSLLSSLNSAVQSQADSILRTPMKYSIIEKIFKNKIHKQKKQAYDVFLNGIKNDKDMIANYYEKWKNNIDADNSQLVPSIECFSDLMNKYLIKIESDKLSYPYSFGITYVDGKFSLTLRR